MQPSLLVACLCAQWCGVCRDYATVFDALSFGPEVQKAWVDIEDHADALGDLDVDSFPTVLIACGDAVLFHGPIEPQPATLMRLVRLASEGALAPLPDPRLAGLPQRVRAALP